MVQPTPHANPAPKTAPGYQAWLSDEAKYADSCYTHYQGQLGIDPGMLSRYLNPVDPWDFRQEMVRRLGDVKGKLLLDYGCGMGEESMYLAKLGAKVVSVDISPKGVELARARARFNGLEIEAHVMDCLNLSFPDHTFDVIHGLGIIHHVGLKQGLKELHRVLKVGGRIVIAEHVSRSGVIEALRARFASDDASEEEGPIAMREMLSYPPSIGLEIVSTYDYAILYRLRRKLSFLFHEATAKKLDHALVKVPFLLPLSGGAVVSFVKVW